MTGSRPTFPAHRLIVVAILVVGVVVSIVAYRYGRFEEREKAEADFGHRATLRHALTREILGHYEDALFGLSALFASGTNISRDEFVRATSRLEDRIAGVQAFEWVPLVPHESRAAVEAAQPRLEGNQPFEFIEFTSERRPKRAADRPYYYPILYVHPLRGNEVAQGYDLMTAPTREVLQRARDSRQMTMSHPIRLVQETGDQPGLVMILPVYRRNVPRRAAGPEIGGTQEVFTGFLQCVFRAHDLLETAYSRQSSGMLDMLFVDRSETDPARRVLYYRPADPAAKRNPPTEAEFMRGMSRDFALPFGGRKWHVLLRAQEGWLESEYTSMPLLRSCSLLLLSALVAGLVHLTGRRTETIKREVELRTAELAESRRQIANMLHALPGMTYRCSYDHQLTVLFVSDGARQLTGWSAEDFMSGKVHFRDCIHSEDIGRVREETRAALQNQSEVEIEYRLKTKTGEEKWVLSRGRGGPGSDGTPAVFEGLAIDITAQKKAEAVRLELERKLLEGQKLESLGLLAGGIAHDFNNLLSSILGNANMARMTLGDSHVIDDQLRAIEGASLRAAELCRQMLAYAGKGKFVVEPTDLTALVNDLLPLLKISVAHQATLTLHLEKVPPVLADATQVRQIVMNLVLNAADAIVDRGGEIVLKTGVMEADYALLANCAGGPGLPKGEYVFVEVRDTGTGMTPEIQSKIFDPFFTTKFAGRGLGLAAVLGIVRGHKGALRVESTPGVGSTFTLLLPPAPPTAVVNPPSETSTLHPLRRPANLLVIDDEEEVRTVMLAMLKMGGYSAKAVADGDAGLKEFREKPDAYDIVVLDLLMPGMSGEQAFRSLRALKPNVKVLLVSGYSEGDILGRLGGGPNLAYLGKPFTRSTLERKVRHLLG
jgi:two-component system, cell cycle sensor histidine kinase and response regulator CckA